MGSLGLCVRPLEPASGVRVSILTFLLAVAAAALWAFPARREGLYSQVLRPREFRV
jgi:hypothetical protein